MSRRPRAAPVLSETHVHPVRTPVEPNAPSSPDSATEDNHSPCHVSGAPKPVPVQLEAFNFKRKRIAATVFKSLILYSYFVHYSLLCV